ncbi:MAG TPA: phosphate ABC transporter substrate-binding protein PstS [Gaiellaceae bacterium]|nr:phosphate ABC transporter substrate-binding protein PstS [Gaiellaceae bacterium]
MKLKRTRSLGAVLAVLGVAALALTAWTSLAGASAKKASLSGAGSTFVAPLVAIWQGAYSAADISYSAVGSGAGIQQITARTVDFGASDAPFTPDQATACNGCVQIPWAYAATSIAYHVSGVTYGLKLTGPILANIYLGNIKKWNDPQIKSINKGVNLPNEDIVPIHRSDGSGTSYNFTDYLSHVSKTWKNQIGKGTSPAWPSGVGVGAKGSSGVSAKLTSTPGGITYVDIAYSYKFGFTIAKIKNRAGKFILPKGSTVAAVSARVKHVPKNNAISVVDPPKSVKNGYPICTFTWALVPLKSSKASTLKPFLKWAVTKGNKMGHKLIFLALPKVVQKADLKTIAKIHS